MNPFYVRKDTTMTQTQAMMTFAAEAASSATDAFGAGYEPRAEIAYKFMRNLWIEDHRAELDMIPAMGKWFEREYDRLVVPA